MEEYPYFKQKIGEFCFRGGLKERREKVIIYYIHPTKEACSKIELKSGIYNYDNEQYTEPPKSLRFESFGDLHALMAELMKAKVKIGKEQGTITPENYGYWLDQEYKLILKAYRGGEAL